MEEDSAVVGNMTDGFCTGELAVVRVWSEGPSPVVGGSWEGYWRGRGSLFTCSESVQRAEAALSVVPP